MIPANWRQAEVLEHLRAIYTVALQRGDEELMASCATLAERERDLGEAER